jgi:hypothetical protein
MTIKRFTTATVNGKLVVIKENGDTLEVREGGKLVDSTRAKQLLKMVNDRESGVEDIDCTIEASPV